LTIYRDLQNNDISAVLTVVLFFFFIFISSIKSGTFEDLLHTYFILFNIWRWNTTTHSLKDLNLFWLYLFIVFIANICIAIKSHQSNQTRSTTCRTFLTCKYSSYFIPFCNIQYIYRHNISSLSTIYTKYSNSTTKYNNSYNSNQIYKYSVTGKDWWHSLIEPELKPTFVNSYINWNISIYYWNNSNITQYLINCII